jgi:hypothetical protein
VGRLLLRRWQEDRLQVVEKLPTKRRRQPLVVATMLEQAPIPRDC